MAAHDTPPRIDPVDPDDATPAQAELLDQLRVDAGSNLFHTYANHPKLMKAWMRFGGRLLLRSAFDPRTRELIILRAAVVCGSHYEWGQHVGIARDAGLDDDEIRRIAAGPDDPAWDAADADLLRAVDELATDHALSDATWAILEQRFDTEQLVELPILVGHYAMLAGLMGALRIAPEAGLPRLGETEASDG